MELARLQPKLDVLGVEALAVVIAQKEPARLYFKRRQVTQMLVAVDPEQRTHQAFRVPYIEILAADTRQKGRWPYGATAEQMSNIRIDPTGELGGPRPIPEGRDELNRRDGVELTPEERQMRARGHQLLGLFLIDRDGVIRWRWVEAMERQDDVGTFPTASEVLSAVQVVASPSPAENRAVTDPR